MTVRLRFYHIENIGSTPAFVFVIAYRFPPRPAGEAGRTSACRVTGFSCRQEACSEVTLGPVRTLEANNKNRTIRWRSPARPGTLRAVLSRLGGVEQSEGIVRQSALCLVWAVPTAYDHRLQPEPQSRCKFFADPTGSSLLFCEPRRQPANATSADPL